MIAYLLIKFDVGRSP